MQGLVTVFGGSGFVGGQVVRALAKAGHRVRVAVRQPNLAYKMRLLGDVGQIEVVQANVRNPASIRRALDGAEACVNLVGRALGERPPEVPVVHVMGAKNVAEAAKAPASASGPDVAPWAPMPTASRSTPAPRPKARPPSAPPSRARPSCARRWCSASRRQVLQQVRPDRGPVARSCRWSAATHRVQPVFVGDVGGGAAKASPTRRRRPTYELGGPPSTRCAR
jgi:hypothetical protein